MARDDVAPILIGAGALLILAKYGLGKIPDFPEIPNPFPAVADAAAELNPFQKDQGESWPEWVFEVDVPCSDKRYSLAPGLLPDPGAVYSTGGPLDPGGQMADIPWGPPIDIAEPDQSIGGYLSEVDFPGLPAYDVRDLPKDILGVFR